MPLSIRTKFGITIAISVLASLVSGWLALILLALATLLIYWGQQPKAAEEFVGGLPFGNQLLKAMARLDLIISSREHRAAPCPPTIADLRASGPVRHQPTLPP